MSTRSDSVSTQVQAPPPPTTDTISTAFSQILPSTYSTLQSSKTEATPTSTPHFNDILRSTTLNPAPLPLSPIKHFLSYERPSYFPLNSYPEYNSHQTPFHTPFSDAPPTQTFHPMGFTAAVNAPPPAPPTYWSDRSNHASLTDPCTGLGYNNYPQSYAQTYDYKKNTLLRNSVYQVSDVLLKLSPMQLSCGNMSF